MVWKTNIEYKHNVYTTVFAHVRNNPWSHIYHRLVSAVARFIPLWTDRQTTFALHGLLLESKIHQSSIIFAGMENSIIVKLKVPLQVRLKVKVKVKVKVRTWSGHGQVRSDSNTNSNSKVGPELYTKIGFHHHHHSPPPPSLNECLEMRVLSKSCLYHHDGPQDDQGWSSLKVKCKL